MILQPEHEHQLVVQLVAEYARLYVERRTAHADSIRLAVLSLQTKEGSWRRAMVREDLVVVHG